MKNKNWNTVNATTEYINIDGDRIPVNIEGILFLNNKYKALELDYRSLLEDIHGLEHELKVCKSNSKVNKFQQEYFILDKDGE
jgi:hypothetical protein